MQLLTLRYCNDDSRIFLLLLIAMNIITKWWFLDGYFLDTSIKYSIIALCGIFLEIGRNNEIFAAFRIHKLLQVRIRNTNDYFRFSNNLKNAHFYTRYAFEGMIQAVYSDRENLSCSTIYCYLQSPNVIIAMMDMPTISFYSILMILGFWIFCLHVFIYTTLYIKIYYARN